MGAVSDIVRDTNQVAVDLYNLYTKLLCLQERTHSLQGLSIEKASDMPILEENLSFLERR